MGTVREGAEVKRKRLRRVSKSPRRKLELKADKLWSEAIRKRDKGICQVCLKPGNNPHHIVTRSVKHLRHDLSNGILLCAGCHSLGLHSAHKRPESFRVWLIEKWFKSERTYDAFILHSNIPRKPDYQAAILGLEYYFKEEGL